MPWFLDEDYAANAARIGDVARAQLPSDGLPRSLPELQGVQSESILAFLEDIEHAGLEVHSFMLARGGSVIAEGWWWPYGPQRIHMTHSLTKSVMVNGVGIAMAEGKFGLDDKVVSFFPEHVPSDASANLKAMAIRDLLTMQTGHDHMTSGSEWRPLNSTYYGLRLLGRTERDQDLIDDHFIKDFVSDRLKIVCHSSCIATGSLYEIGQAFSS